MASIEKEKEKSKEPAPEKGGLATLYRFADIVDIQVSVLSPPTLTQSIVNNCGCPGNISSICVAHNGRFRVVGH